MTDIIADVASQFLHSEKIKSIRKLEAGHINETMIITAGRKYICQKMNSRLYADKLNALGHNYLSYAAAYAKDADILNDWIVPGWLTCPDGSFFYTDQNGDLWRMYEYVDGISGKEVLGSLSPSGRSGFVYECGRTLCKMHFILMRMDEYPEPVLPKLHNLSYHYGNYVTTRRSAGDNSPHDLIIEKIIGEKIEGFMTISVHNDSFVHGDAKIDNMLFVNSRGISFIDLDTISVGSAFDDVADSIRSCCFEEGSVNPDLMKAFIDGYRDDQYLIHDEINEKSIMPVLYKNMFELGIRYYTDYLNENKYFQEVYPGQNLEKARRLLMQFSTQR